MNRPGHDDLQRLSFVRVLDARLGCALLAAAPSFALASLAEPPLQLATGLELERPSSPPAGRPSPGPDGAPPLRLALATLLDGPAAQRTAAAGVAQPQQPSPRAPEAPLPLEQVQAPPPRSRASAARAPQPDAAPAPSGAAGEAADGPSAPLPLDQVQAPPRSAQGSGGRPDETLPDMSAVGWQLAPIQWGGNVSAMVNHFRDADGGRIATESANLELRGASHVYQPWFAQLNGNVNLLAGRTGREGGNFVNERDSSGTSVLVGGSLNLFPLSRFPFRAYLDMTDSRASANNTGVDFTNTRLGLRQDYRPEGRMDNYSATYDRSVLENRLTKSTVDSFQANMSASRDKQGYSAAARYSQAEAGLSGEASRLLSVTGAHNYVQDETFTVASTIDYSDQELRYIGPAVGRPFGLFTNNNRVAQASSNFTWMPDEDLPLTVTGGANLLGMQGQTSTSSTRLNNISAYLGAMYRFTDRFIGNGNLTLNQSSSDISRQTLYGGSGTLSYLGRPLTFGNFLYNWNVSGTAMLQTGSSEGAMNSGYGQFNHGLTRSIVYSNANVLSLTANQNFSYGSNTTSGRFGTLVNSLGASWRLGYEDRLTGIFSATLADNRTTGQYEGSFSTFNLNGNGLWQISRRAGLNVSANLVWSQQRQDQDQGQAGNLSFVTAGTDNWVGSASIGYNHFSPFDISNLVYRASLQYTSSQTDRRIIAGDPTFNPLEAQVTRAFEQRLYYYLGRLTFEAWNSIATLNGKKNALIFFQVRRDFGRL